MEPENLILDEGTQAFIIQKLSEKLRECYIFPNIAEQICVDLQNRLESGQYTNIKKGRYFAFALTVHMQEVYRDEHLWVRWHPDPIPDGENTLRLNQEWVEKQRLEARQENYGLHKVERLAGNVGYLDIRKFHKPEWGGDTAAAAMNFVADTNALIIDLRKCTGGYPGMVTLLSSYFFGEEPVLLGSIYWRDDDAVQQYWTLPNVPGRRFIDKPIYILTSKGTFSAGEGFASNLQALKRATLIGEQTDGGMHPGASYRLHPHFEAFIPIGYTIDPITGAARENGIGVIPDIPTAAEQALNAAYKLALESILEGTVEVVSDSLMEEAQAALKEIEVLEPR